MPPIKRIDNLTEALQSPGVFIFEEEPLIPFRGVGTSKAQIVGEFEWGPSGQVVVAPDIQSYRFKRLFGGYGDAPTGEELTWSGYSGYKALAGLRWPAGLEVIRVDATGSAAASVAIDLVAPVGEASGITLTVPAKYKGRRGNAMQVTVSSASDTALTNGFKLTFMMGNRAESVDNLYAGMTTLELRARTKDLELPGLMTLAVNADADPDNWPSLAQTYDLAGGLDGDAVLADWTDAIDKLLARRGLSVLAYAQPNAPVTNAALNAYIKGAVVGKPVIPILHGPSGDVIASASTGAAGLRAPDRMAYAWPWAYRTFPEAATTHADGKVLVPLSSVIASALVNIDPRVDISGTQATKYINAAVTALEYDDIADADYVVAQAQGILAAEYDADLGFRVACPFLTSVTPGKELLYRRRLADYLLESCGATLKYYMGQPMTDEWVAQVKSGIEDYLDGEIELDRVKSYDPIRVEQYGDSPTGNHAALILMKVDLHDIALHLILSGNIQTGRVTGTEVQSFDEVA